MEIMSAKTHVIYDSLCGPFDLGEEKPEFYRFWCKAHYLLVNSYGEVEEKRFITFNIYAVDENDAREKVDKFFKDLNLNDEEREWELVDVSVIKYDGRR